MATPGTLTPASLSVLRMDKEASFDGTPFSSFWLKPRCSDSISFHLPIPSWNTLRRLGIVINTLSFRRRSFPTFPPLFTISSAAASQRRSSLFSASDLGFGAISTQCWGCLAHGSMRVAAVLREALLGCLAPRTQASETLFVLDAISRRRVFRRAAEPLEEPSSKIALYLRSLGDMSNAC